MLEISRLPYSREARMFEHISVVLFRGGKDVREYLGGLIQGRQEHAIILLPPHAEQMQSGLMGSEKRSSAALRRIPPHSAAVFPRLFSISGALYG